MGPLRRSASDPPAEAQTAANRRWQRNGERLKRGAKLPFTPWKVRHLWVSGSAGRILGNAQCEMGISHWAALLVDSQRMTGSGLEVRGIVIGNLAME
ncbi:hypothetical protein GCM10010869_21780 [Mesorhizobium tianshanense]|nr:hypothetical protein GCM10010869_21780 [Mesorhizobium tianshanense]